MSEADIVLTADRWRRIGSAYEREVTRAAESETALRLAQDELSATRERLARLERAAHEVVARSLPARRRASIAALAAVLERGVGTRFVNAYHVEQRYGGPEEGGWFYEAGTLLESVEIPAYSPHSDAFDMRTALAAKYADRVNGPSADSVLLDGEIRVEINYWPGESFPKTRPRYE